MKKITISQISGATYPVVAYVSDINRNNLSLLGVINLPVPPEINFTTQIPTIFDTANQVIITMVDSENVEYFEIIDCKITTPTPSPTPTVTPGLPIPSQTPTLSQTPTVTISPTMTKTPNPTPTVTRTPRPTYTPTPTKTQPEPYKAYIFAEPQNNTTDLELFTFANNQGANNWYSWYGNGVPNNNSGTYSQDLNIYAHQPNFIIGSDLYIKPTDLSSNIARYQGEIINGLPQNIYTFGSITIELTGESRNTLYFYSIWIPLDGVGGSMSAMTIDVGTSKSGTEVYDSLPAIPSTLSHDVVVTVGGAIPEGTYRVIWISPQMQLPAKLPLNVILYIRGDTKF